MPYSLTLSKYWQLNQNNQKTEHIETQANATQKVALINSTKEYAQNNLSLAKRHRQNLV